MYVKEILRYFGTIFKWNKNKYRVCARKKENGSSIDQDVEMLKSFLKIELFHDEMHLLVPTDIKFAHKTQSSENLLNMFPLYDYA